MKLLVPVIAMVRVHQLGRQFTTIERSVRALSKRNRMQLSTLTLREIGQAAQSDFPHLYGTAPEARYLPWGSGTCVGYARAQSANIEVSLRGIALWLAVAYHETKNSSHAPVQAQHRKLLHVLRELKEVHRDAHASAHPWALQERAAA
ncbi:MAG: hypothetical protein ABIU96_00575 [Rhodanobacter sp.]